ncbi:ABC transporter ATP-binding protein [Vibrio intestinalis]|uniref:ABC transporter ATP-binding protein n=1 Tax=Vibrio intestinalis TaxID=2933291 RepID=UPI0021A8CCE2|nr:ABC transporter ATP-binding protein [Vibrio intestinalis]
MSKLCFENFSFRYAENSNGSPTLQAITLTIYSGECLLLTGGSGSGKSTLIRAMSGLIPNFYNGDTGGHLYLDGEELSSIPETSLYRKIATVYQNPRSQFFTNKIGSELVFSAENFAVERATIEKRLQQTLAHFQLEGREHNKLDLLSSGEKQRVACAGASLMRPEIILLDEPSANLDAKAAHMLAKAITYWKQQGMTVIVAEHRSAYLDGLVDRQVHLDKGRISEVTSDSFYQAPESNMFMGERSNKLSATGSAFVSPDENWLISPRTSLFSRVSKQVKAHCIAKSAIVAVVGENGAGKSSLFRQLCGLDKGAFQLGDEHGLLKGKDLRRRCFFVDQEVNRQLLCDSVLEEVMLNMPSDDESQAVSILNELDLGDLLEAHPLAISGGQKQRLALAIAVAANREFTVLDEPTSGLDRANVARVIKQIAKLRENGSTVIIISHEPELLLRCCDWAIHISKRNIDQIYRLDDTGNKRLLRFMQRGETEETEGIRTHQNALVVN